jgi:hypothetical protein
MEQTSSDSIQTGDEATIFSSCYTTRTEMRDSSTPQSPSALNASGEPSLSLSSKTASEITNTAAELLNSSNGGLEPAGVISSTPEVATGDSTVDEEDSLSSSDKQELRKGKWTVCTLRKGFVDIHNHLILYSFNLCFAFDSFSD